MSVILMSSSHCLLLQGGLANQLCQAALVSYEEHVGLKDLVVTDSLFGSRLRSLRSVTRRDVSPLFDSLLNSLPWHRLLVLRACFRLGLFSSLSCSNTLDRVELGGCNYYKGHGVTSAVFSESYEPFWSAVIDELDLRFGVVAPVSASFAMHVRQGDFLNPKTQLGSGLYPLSLNYYLRALSVLVGCESQSSPWLVFTDSPETVSANFIPALGAACKVVTSVSAEYDLWRLSHCSQLILSNSTFSCVAAHLASIRKSLRRVVAPARWFIDSRDFPNGDLRKPEWIQV
ncbi:alpha-1,2-fucosyltransferase [Cyanobium sp. FACHB-13342]|uniref:alpha-1,2-fucosyltransferase n=1 Tax=Cyanobium sp. FACHB-13342 TaxID=2692793 RepID=UPI0016811D41|nr:alpha-1,2-fucosyltransferase [Cyanobium sp. FACHB-13342]MBD2423781.1 alpha-1,2-fucosyltransferase [Cyanobium sp. FACHB-13342]